jgi:hypothetical protein
MNAKALAATGLLGLAALLASAAGAQSRIRIGEVIERVVQALDGAQPAASK